MATQGKGKNWKMVKAIEDKPARPAFKGTAGAMTPKKSKMGPAKNGKMSVMSQVSKKLSGQRI